MKRKMTLLLAAAAPTAIALIAAGLISLASGSPYPSGAHSLAAATSSQDGAAGAAAVGTGDARMTDLAADPARCASGGRRARYVVAEPPTTGRAEAKERTDQRATSAGCSG